MGRPVVLFVEWFLDALRRSSSQIWNCLNSLMWTENCWKMLMDKASASAYGTHTHTHTPQKYPNKGPPLYIHRIHAQFRCYPPFWKQFLFGCSWCTDCTTLLLPFAPTRTEEQCELCNTSFSCPRGWHRHLSRFPPVLSAASVRRSISLSKECGKTIMRVAVCSVRTGSN